MKPMKLDVFFAMFCYGGNGGIGMQLPEITLWYAQTFCDALKDERIGRISTKRFGDTPLPMERNRAVRVAKDWGADVIVMIDSDNVPDLYLGRKPWAKPFWSTSFAFLYQRKQQGLPTVVCAPYCGPPPHPQEGGFENVYVFHAETDESDVTHPAIRFVPYSREHAMIMRGMQSIAAGPTGCVMYSLDAFDLMGVEKRTQQDILLDFQAGKLTLDRACQLLNKESWFFYEYTDTECTRKASTEDVTNTREIQMAGVIKHGQPVVFCNWDAWAGHYKPKCVGMPEPIYVEQVTENFQQAVKQNVSADDSLQEVKFTAGLLDTVLKEGEPEPEFVQQILREIAAEQETAEEAASSSTTEDAPAGPPPVAVSYPQCNRLIGSHYVTTIGNITAMEDLNAMTEIVAVVADSRPQKELRIVEVGSWVGESALAMHNGLGPAGGTIYCVDTWEGTPTDKTGEWAQEIGFERLFETFRKNVGSLLDQSIKVLRGDSLDIAHSMEPQDLDIVFLDAGHDYAAIKADLEAWMPHVSVGGVLAGHDYSVHFPGVMQAVNEMCAAAGIRPRLINNTCVWMVLKKEYVEGLQRQEQARQQVTKVRKRRRKAEEDDAHESVIAGA